MLCTGMPPRTLRHIRERMRSVLGGVTTQEHGNDRQRISNIAFFFRHRAFYRAG